MMRSRRDRRKLLSPVLSDEPLVGQNLNRRLRIVLLSMLIAFLLTNVTSYLLGQAVRAEADRDTRSRVSALEDQVNADLSERGERRDAEVAEQDAKLAQLRADLCVALDRVQPRDAAVLAARKRNGCTATSGRPSQAPQVGSTASSARPGDKANAGGSGPGSQVAPPPGPTGPSGPPGRPGPSAPTLPIPPPPEAPEDGGLICLPLLGCVL